MNNYQGTLTVTEELGNEIEELYIEMNNFMRLNHLIC